MKLRPAMPASEHQLQAQLCTLLELMLKPGIRYTAIASGGKRHIRVAVRLKAEGVKKGAPDMVFFLPGGRTASLEMKARRGSLSPEQKAWRDDLRALGHDWAVAKTVDEALEFLRSVGALKSIMK